MLASTAIQLLDERKSPIAAGRWLSLSHSAAGKTSFSCHLCGLFLARGCLQKPPFYQYSQELLLPGIYLAR